jgi:hypothetical protein
MEQKERELLTRRIMAGVFRCRTSDGLFHIKDPTPVEKYIAEDIFNDSYHEAVLDGALDEDGLETLLEDKGIWTPVQQGIFDKLVKDTEELKLSLYNGWLNSNHRVAIKEALKKTKNQLFALNDRKHSHDYISAMGVATLHKMRFLTAMSIHSADDRKLFTAASYGQDGTLLRILETITDAINKNRLTEEDFRELARTDPWRTIWFTRRATGDIVFSCSSTELSDDQRTLAYWSQVYENINENPKAPPEDLIADNDALDGWFISQHRLRKKMTDKELIEGSIKSEKIKSSSEIFVVTNKDDAHRVYDINEADGRARQRALFKKIEREGAVEVMNQPDAIVEKQIKLQEMYKDKVMK